MAGMIVRISGDGMCERAASPRDLRATRSESFSPATWRIARTRLLGLRSNGYSSQSSLRLENSKGFARIPLRRLERLGGANGVQPQQGPAFRKAIES